MGKERLLAIDAGTGSVRAVLFDTDGKEIATAQTEWTHLSDPRFPGSMDFDWNKNWSLAGDCVRRVLKESGTDAVDVCAVSTTCMREGILLYDKEGREIWACANVDARANEEVRELAARDPDLEKKLYARSGEAYALGALPRLLWVKKHLPEVYDRTARIGMFNDWLIYKLTGEEGVEPSNGSTTGLFDLRTRCFDPEIAGSIGLRTDIFPRSVECGTRIGTVYAKGAADTGLKEGTPVIAGGGDTQLGALGVGVIHAGEAALFGGSFWQYVCNTQDAKTDEKARVRVNCHAVRDLWQYEALAFNPGLVMRWYRDAFCEKEKAEAEKAGRDTYDLMNEAAAKIPAGSYGMCAAFSDIMNFTAWRHASPTFTNFDIDPVRFNRYTFYRAILENAALVTKGHRLLIKEATGYCPDAIVFASGASKSALWSQIVADVLNVTVKVPVVKEATALGAALLAGCGVGIYKDIDEAVKRCVVMERTHTPDPANREIYDDLYDTWRKVYAAQLSLSDAGVTRYMWCAPGAGG